MSGILNSKSRIVDAIFTSEGRRQMAEGTFEVSYVTFSDYGISYMPDSVNGHVDPAGKIYFEACNLPQDQITFEANDEGKLLPFRSQDIKLKSEIGNISSTSSEGNLVNGRLVAYKLNQGRRIKASSINENVNDIDKGFVYTGINGAEAKILIKPDLAAGLISGSLSSPYKAYIGTQGGLSSNNFATSISGAISLLSSSGGPDVQCFSKNDSVYLDIGQSIVNIRIYSTGTLSSPLLLENAKIGGSLLVDELESASFASQIQGILTSSFDNFIENQTLASINRLFEDDKFTLSTDQLSFDLSRVSSNTYKNFKVSPPSLNSIDSIFSDDKFSNLDNFLYLPPIVKTSDTVVPDKTKLENFSSYLLGDYPSWGDNEKKLTYEKLKDQISQFEDPKTTVYFEETSNNNRVIGQLFEVTDKFVSKLDVVDFGEMKIEEFEGETLTNKVFFAGKTFMDNRGTTCFVNMFTLVLSKDDRAEREEMIQ